MKKSNLFTWSRLFKTMIALMVILSMLLCGCAEANPDDDGGKKGNSGSNQVIFGDGDGSMEAQDIVDSLTNLYGALLNAGGGNRPDDFGYEMDLEVTVGDTLMSQLGAALGQMGLSSDVSWFEKLGLGMKINSKDDMIQEELDIKLNGKTILSGEVILDMVGNMVYMGVPELNSQYIGGEVDFSQMNVAMKGGMEMLDTYVDLMKALPSDSELNKVLSAYLQVIIDNMPEPTEGTTDLSVGSVTLGVTTNTYSISSKDMLAMAEQALTKAETDEDLEALLDGFSEALNIQGEKMEEAGVTSWTELDLHAELMENIDYLLESLEDAKAQVDDETLIALVSYCSGDDCVGFSLRVNSGYTMTDYLTVYSLNNDGKTGLMVDIMGVVQFSGVGKESSGKLSGDYVLSSYGQNFLHVELKNFDTDAMKKGNLKGTVRLSLDDVLLDRMSSSLPISEDTVIELVFDTTGSSAKTTINLYEDDVLLFGLKVTAKMTSGSSIKIPSDYANAESSSDMEKWLGKLKFDGIISNLKGAGVPGSLIEILEQALENGLGFVPEAPENYPVATSPAYGH